MTLSVSVSPVEISSTVSVYVVVTFGNTVGLGISSSKLISKGDEVQL